VKGYETEREMRSSFGQGYLIDNSLGQAIEAKSHSRVASGHMWQPLIGNVGHVVQPVLADGHRSTPLNRGISGRDHGTPGAVRARGGVP
jgi:hypothetical protein